MIVRFQADANLNQILLLAVRRREPTVDFQTATEAGLAGLIDPEVLARAAQDGRGSQWRGEHSAFTIPVYLYGDSVWLC